MRIAKCRPCFACCSENSRRQSVRKYASLQICRNCGAQWIEDGSTLQQGYQYSGYSTNDLAQRYHQTRAKRFAAYVQKHAGRITGDLLDVGCGTGEFLSEVAELGWNCTGIELSEGAARLSARYTGLPIVVGNLTHGSPFCASSFDAITLWGVLEHVPDPIAVLRACRLLLRPNGLLLLETPNADSLFRIVARSIMVASGGRIVRPFLETLGAGHLIWCSPRSLIAVAARLDMKVYDLRSSRNSTEILMARWRRLPLHQKLIGQSATAILNYLAQPLCRPNQMLAILTPAV